MRTRIKICGITRLEDARFCAAEGADYLGFVLHSGSPRRVGPALAKEIIEWVYGPQTVGIFVDEPPDRINEIVDEVGFDLVQLHGQETPDVCRQINFPVIKAVSVDDSMTADEVRAEVDRFAVVAGHVLLDTRRRDKSGGTGETFDWRLAEAVARDHDIFLAGGINHDNIGDAIDAVHPFAIDLSSGVEQTPGVKDFDLLSRLFQALRAASDAS